MLENCIINYAHGSWYPRGQDRLRRSLADVRFSELGDTFAFNEKMLLCPPHAQVPYAFKVAAFVAAAYSGYRSILWCDAAVWAIKPLDPLFDYLHKHGHIFFYGGFNCGQWTSDACLERMKVTRDEAEKMPMYMACCMGLDLWHQRSVEFLQRLTAYGADGVSFQGAWQNEPGVPVHSWGDRLAGHVSHDPRCLGHRHDQSVGSILAHQMGMDQLIGHETFFQYFYNGVYRYGEKNDMTGVGKDVVLLSQGM